MTLQIAVTQYMSLDGVIEDPVGMEDSGLGNWTGPYQRGPKGDRFKLEELMNAEHVLLGRKTYDGFAAVWPTVHDPDGMADRMNSLPKYVATHRPDGLAWNNSHAIGDDLVASVCDLKKQNAGTMLVYGSASIVRQLAAARLIDEYRIMLYPVILGRGVRLFAEDGPAVLQLAESDSFGDGIHYLRYRVTAGANVAN